MVIHNF